MKFLQNMKKKDNNKGFSLVELIIVIAIMAILVGIVGTQVIPYLNKSRVEKDRQIMSAVSTAAVSTYTSNAEAFPSSGTVKMTISKSTFGYTVTSGITDAAAKTAVQDSLKSYCGYDAWPSFSSSAMKDDCTALTITYDFDNKNVKVEATGASDVDPVESHL